MQGDKIMTMPPDCIGNADFPSAGRTKADYSHIEFVMLLLEPIIDRVDRCAIL
jgi:hypothetical protein